MTARVPAIVLPALLALFAGASAAASPDLVATINELRAKGCGPHLKLKLPLRADPLLDRVAQALMSGKNLEEAMTSAGYRAVRSASIAVSGGDEGIARTLARRGCEEIMDPVHRDVGIAERANDAWIVLAAPFVPPGPSQAETVAREVLALINEARAGSRRCGRKRFDAVAPLVPSDTLQAVALAHARDMAERSTLSHEGRDGSTPAQRATRAGYLWFFVGENVAAGQATAERVVAEWLQSPHHCANLMNPDFTETGVAYEVDMRSSAGIYWAQVFGMPRE